eukprot:scaffold2082_cov111-Isochrysis_galbana.AAC.1
MAVGVTDLRGTLEQFAKDTRIFSGASNQEKDTYTLHQAFQCYNGHLLWLLSRHLEDEGHTTGTRSPPPAS